jgi:hypothetical protein
MHPIKINDSEFTLLKKAKKDRNWKILHTWKLRYIYQRFVVLPAKDYKAVKEIAEKARERNLESCEKQESVIKYNKEDLPF